MTAAAKCLQMAAFLYGDLATVARPRPSTAVALASMAADDGGEVIDFASRTRAKNRGPQKTRVQYDDEGEVVVSETVLADIERIKADSRIRVGQATVFDETEKLLARANEITAWKRPKPTTRGRGKK